jgi:hypothetical protein
MLLYLKLKQSLEVKDKDNSRYSSTLSHGGDPGEDPEDPEEDNNDSEEESSNNNNTIIIVPEHNMEKLHFLSPDNLKSEPVITYNSLVKDRNLILSSHKSTTGIYLLHNLVNGKQYVGSAYDLRKRLATYYFPSRLTDNRYISNSILKYGHDNFSLAILEILGNKDTHFKTDILLKEQFYIDLYKPILNLNPRAGSSLGFKHSEESKKLIAEFRKGKPLSEETKSRLSDLLSGELNPF